MKTRKQIIELINERMKSYKYHKEHHYKELTRNMEAYTSYQVQQEMIFISDMESREYALRILLEEINEE